ncbi:MAG TPA: transposase [Ignavibacteriaceae bacterium]|nr:transposase [Ignavibacteriaceae bacterium]
MAKRNVKFLKGKYFHIYNRGANKKKIFFEEENYFYLLKKLKHYSKKYEFSVIAYCLLPNHYHFVFRQDGDTPLNIPIAFLFNGYTKAVNKRYSRTGTLFEGPFKSIEVEDVNYLLELCRYIHRNPVDDGLVKKLEDWEFSNYLEWIGKRNGSLVDLKLRNKYFSDSDKYKSYVENYKSIKRAVKGLRKYLLELNNKKKI